MIEFENLCVSFKDKNGTFDAVKDVSFNIEKGDVFGIVGGSGAGKSTLLRTINLLQKPTSGNVIVNGKNVSSLKHRRLREHRKNIGMIFQHFNLAANKTVYENIAFVLKVAGWKKDAIDNRVKELLEFVKLSDKEKSYPSRLSGGQKQRVAIARALANNTEILLCDEPTSALDAETTNSVLELLQRVNKELGVTIVIITHELDVVKSICNKTVVMNKGKVVENGNVYSVFTSSKNEFTKDLIAHTQNFTIPAEFRKATKGDIYKITYLGDKAAEPVLSYVSKQFNVNTNIIHGKIEYIESKPVGILFVNFEGDEKEIQKAVETLKEKVYSVEVA